jgi:teichuronic acid biosynthesis glycosyltransferase TuaG
MMSEDGQMTNSLVTAPLKTTYQNLLRNTMIGTLTVMINKNMLGKVQMELHRDCSEDYGLWLSILANGIDAYGLREELAYYRRCEKSLSSNKLNSALKTWNTYRKIRGIGRVSAAWYFIHYSVNALKKHRKAF